MQSLRQYRRMRAEVQKDVALMQNQGEIKAPVDGSPTGTLTPENKEAVSDGEKEHVPGGVTVSRPAEHDGSVLYLVGWKDGDSMNPHNWSRRRKWFATFGVSLLTMAITVPSSIDAPVSGAFNEHFGVNPMAGSLTTGMYLIGSGTGALFAGTISETFGRNVMYMTTFVVFMLFIMAKALAPNFGAAIIFRFLTGFFGSTPMTAAGGSVADLWSPLELIFVVPVGAMTSYAGPIVGPIIGAYLPGFRWADWVSLIIAGAVLAYVVIFQPETYRPVLLEWRAKHLRDLTGDSRYRVDEHATTHTLAKRLLVNLYRPFLMTATEPIILIFTFYLTIVYFVLFTFLNGFPFIFQQTYGISVPLTFIIFVALLVGDLAALPLVPIIYGWAKKAAAAGTLTPEICLWYGMLGGSILLPISLWWLAWTCYSDISIWVPIVGSALFGYGLVTIFATTFLYTVYVYGIHSASALAFMTSVRYIIAGALIPASVPMYQNLGPHLALTIPAVLATIMAPVPFILYKYGAKIRGMSKNAMPSR
ncbi:major facilitator superfamily domain-containing protein [Bombardia bombarda]|uniref:Major facilitator superfamily domain-containing protein n=1 Tax=Bombardia bombarda TaxID=252184 RepID=A0AA39XQ88_9PEZI|nr:major facilitator superfamily domain-containing protein [Bombardia bombarda]